MRADGGASQGSGHIMRCLTLAEALRSRGHDVELAADIDGVPWLESYVAECGFPRVSARAHRIDGDALTARRPDVVVVDSYRIPAAEISALAARVPVLAIVDGDHRGIEADLYLDQNLGAEDRAWPTTPGTRVLAGAAYALVRSEIRDARRDEPWRITGVPRVLALMGGTDATGGIVLVAAQLASLGSPVDLTVIAGDTHRDAVSAELSAVPSARVVAPTVRLGELFAEADIVVSAAGTSSWDICTLGLPAVMVAVVDNQVESLRQMVDRGLVLGIDASLDVSAFAGIAPAVERLIADESARQQLSRRSVEQFDGRGASRVADALEQLAARRTPLTRDTARP